MPHTILSIGDLVADIVAAIPHFPVEPNAHQLTHSLRLEPGGAGNFLIAGALLGCRMISLGALGDDPFGAAIVQALQAEGVDLRGLIRQPGSSSTTVIVLTDETGRHVFLGGYGLGPAITLPEIWRDILTEAHAVFVSGYTLQEKRLAAAALEAMALAHAKGAPVFFDPGPEMVNLTLEQRETILKTSDAILLTEEEIPLMADGVEGTDAARGLMAAGPRLVAVKLGPRCCLIFTPDAQAEHPGFPVAVRDTTAAGDSFAAAFIYAYLRGWPLADVAAFANAMGAAKVQKIGSGSQVPTADEVRAVLREFGAGVKF